VGIASISKDVYNIKSGINKAPTLQNQASYPWPLCPFAHRGFHIVHIPRQITCSMLITHTFTVTQKAESVLRAVLDMEVLPTNVFKTVFKVQNRAWIYPGDMTCTFSILVPAPALIRPDHTLEELLTVNIVVFNGFFLDID
jgi:hypothetical protein